MSDFLDFSRAARAAFPSLHVSVMMYEKASARGGELLYYRLKVEGMALGTEALTATDTSAEQVINTMIGQVGRARRLVRERRGQELSMAA